MEENEILTENEETVTEEAPAVKRHGIAAEIYDWFDSVFYGLLILTAVFILLTRTTSVDGTSMLPTLEDKQLLLVSDFGYTPAYNDIVVVWSDTLPKDDGEIGKAIVKRVIGLEGDTINIDFFAGTVTRNGEVLPIEEKDGILYEDGHMINALTRTDEGQGGDFIVPEGCLFVMGDNRNGSTDSRSRLIGFIDRRNVVGKAYLRVFPFDKFGGLYDD